MKTQILSLLSIFAMLGTIFQAKSQEIPNGNMEGWSDVAAYENPVLYETSNFHLYNSGGELNALKTTDAQDGNYALQLTTKAAPEVNVNGMAFIGYPGENTIFGGIPFNQKPTAIKAWVKYDIKDLDTANIVVIFKTSSYPNGIARLQLTGTQSEYTQVTITPTWYLPSTIMPDTMTVVLTSSTTEEEAAPQVGSTITLDNFSFEGISDEFPNFSFEDWETVNLEEPDSWISSNGFTSNGTGTSVIKSTDSFEGDYAAQIVTQKTIWGDYTGFLANCYVGNEAVYGGMAVDDNPATISGYYKYEGIDSDSALLYARTTYFDENTNQSEILEEVFVKLGNSSEYIPFEIPFEHTGAPLADSLSIAFSSSNYDNEESVRLGSSLTIDDISIVYESDNIAEHKLQANVSPNPASDEVRFELSRFLNSSMKIEIYNAKGQIVKSQNIKMGATTTSLDVSGLKPGMYFYRLTGQKEPLEGKFIIK